MLEPLSCTNSIRELEVSLTHRCTLDCQECGFFIREQPIPHKGPIHLTVINDLEKLLQMGITVERLVLVGGEPTLAKETLRRVCEYARGCLGIREVEVVSNGLSPDRVDAELLRKIDRLVISEYVEGPGLIEAWERWASTVASNTKVVGRRHEKWDKFTGDVVVEPSEALQFWRTCWYRKHCITLERGRLFSCSRIPKLGNDEEGLLLRDSTTLDEIREWLNADRALPSCSNCVPMMGFPKVASGVQPDDRLKTLEPRAVRILNERVDQ